MQAEGRAAGIDLAYAARQAALAGLIAFALFLPLVGFKTVQNIHNELVLETRWPVLAAFVVIIALGRFLYALIASRLAAHMARRAVRERSARNIAWRSTVRRWLITFAPGFTIF